MTAILRFVLLTTAVTLLFPTTPAAAAECDNSANLLNQYETTIRYYNASQQPVGFEIYSCWDTYTYNGTLSGVWIKQTDVDCETGQPIVGYFYLCSDGIYHTVAYIGDTDCS